jgi:hypothetical protein
MFLIKDWQFLGQRLAIFGSKIGNFWVKDWQFLGQRLEIFGSTIGNFWVKDWKFLGQRLEIFGSMAEPVDNSPSLLGGQWRSRLIIRPRPRSWGAATCRYHGTGKRRGHRQTAAACASSTCNDRKPRAKAEREC